MYSQASSHDALLPLLSWTTAGALGRMPILQGMTTQEVPGYTASTKQLAQRGRVSGHGPDTHEHKSHMWLEHDS